MGYVRYVGRIGALAVTLGVGVAVASTPGIAYAQDDSGSPSAGDSTPAPTGDGIEPSASDTPPADPAGGPSETPADGDLEADDDSAEALEDAVDEEEPTAGEVDDDIPPAAGDEVLAATSGLDGGSAQRLYGASANELLSSGNGVSAIAFADPGAGDDTQGFLAAAVDRSSRLIGQRSPSLGTVAATARDSLAPVANARAGSFNLFPPMAATRRIDPPPPPTLAEVLEEPHTVAVHVLSHVANAFLEVALFGLGPGSPLRSQELWAALAGLRDRLELISRRNPSPQQTTAAPALAGYSENLLVNPGAEDGDPSLTGYSAVTVPGWALTGTPTVIEYGTERQFPSPFRSPGPVFPNFLAFPGPNGGIPIPPNSGNQFFGGGPVASSALTQVVDFSPGTKAIIQTGAGAYVLSADLGGFLLDRSSTSITVNFRDAGGELKGSDTLSPITVRDRIGATGLLPTELSASIPVDTTQAEIVVTFTDRNPILGNYNNAYADNISFVVNDVTAMAPPGPTEDDSYVGHLDHIFMVYLENKGVSQIVGSDNAPFINNLYNNYGVATNYFALTHPSDPNYYPILGGSDFGTSYNCPSDCFDEPNLALDRIDTYHPGGDPMQTLSWAGFAEGGGGFSEVTDRLPFLAFSDIFNDIPLVFNSIFDLPEMASHLEDPDTAPNFVWFAADDANNMEGPTDIPFGALRWLLGFLSPAHQYNVKAGDTWLQDPIGQIMRSNTWKSNEKCAIFVTFDEDYNNISLGVGNEGNQIVMIVIPNDAAMGVLGQENPGEMKEGPIRVTQHYNHYSLQRTIEVALGDEGGPALAPLTNNDRYAVVMSDFWNPLP